MAKKSDKSVRQDIIDAALKLSEEQGWAYISVSDIAKEAGMSLAELFDHVDDKTDILCLFGRMIDRKVLDAIGEPDLSVSPRDQLFDIMMERYEILNEYRKPLLSILESFRFDPKQAVISCPHLARSMAWMLEASGIETPGIRGAIKVAGLTGVYLKVLRVWKDDESSDLGKVMAALDKDLGRAEQVANTLGF